MPGTPSWKNPTSSPQSEPENGHRSRFKAVGMTPDLRKLPLEVHDLFKDILLKGALAPRGMERFDDLLSEADAGAIHAYLINQRCPPFRGRVNEGRQRGAASRWRTGRMVIRHREEFQPATSQDLVRRG